MTGFVFQLNFNVKLRNKILEDHALFQQNCNYHVVYVCNTLFDTHNHILNRQYTPFGKVFLSAMKVDYNTQMRKSKKLFTKNNDDLVMSGYKK